MLDLFFEFGNQSKKFVIQLIDSIIANAEILLDTIFKSNLGIKYEDDINFNIVDAFTQILTNLDKVKIYLQNIRVMMFILTNILNNQFKVLIR